MSKDTLTTWPRWNLDTNANACSASSLSTVSIEDIKSIRTPKIFQLYFHKDKGLTDSMIQKCKYSKIDALALTVDTITGGNRERDLRTGFTSPPKLNMKSFLSFLFSPKWTLNYLFRKKFIIENQENYSSRASSNKFSI